MSLAEDEGEVLNFHSMSLNSRKDPQVQASGSCERKFLHIRIKIQPAMKYAFQTCSFTLATGGLQGKDVNVSLCQAG